MLLDRLVAVSNDVAAASGRLEKIDRLAALLRSLAPEDVAFATAPSPASRGRGASAWARLPSGPRWTNRRRKPPC
jgi:hypothetical protein